MKIFFLSKNMGFDIPLLVVSIPLDIYITFIDAAGKTLKKKPAGRISLLLHQANTAQAIKVIVKLLYP